MPYLYGCVVNHNSTALISFLLLKRMFNCSIASDTAKPERRYDYEGKRLPVAAFEGITLNETLGKASMYMVTEKLS